MNSKLTKFAQAAVLGLAITLTLNACEEKKKQDGTAASTAEPAAATTQETASESQPSGVGGCPDKEPSITTEAVFLAHTEDGEEQVHSTFRLPGGEEITFLGEDDVKKGDKVSITYKSMGRHDFDGSCYYVERIISLKKIGKSANILTDTRDKKIYWTTKIGEQVWIAENLNIEMGKSVCPIDECPEGDCNDERNKKINCKIYGRLYDWETAMKACPSGWHLPSNAEWDKLLRYVDGTSGTESPYESKTAGKYLDANHTNKFGFSAERGGRIPPDGADGFAGFRGYWWSSSEDDNDHAYSRIMGEDAVYYGSDWKNFQYSVRCIQN